MYRRRLVFDADRESRASEMDYLLIIRCGIVGVACTLAACSSGPNLVGLGELDATPVAAEHRIFISSTRREADDVSEFLSGERAESVRFATVDVTIPLNHQPGSIELPRDSSPDPTKHFLIQNPENLKDGEAFISQINNQIRGRAQATKSAMVFVHGYNTNTTEAITRLAQIVQDSGYDGIPILFTWPSNRKTIDYVSDINSAAFSRDALVDLAFALNRSNLDEFYIIGHSMGGFLVMEAVRSIGLRNQFDRLSKNSDIILASPDIDIDLFGSQIRPLDFERSKITVLMSQDDKALQLSQRIAGDYPRVGAADPQRLSALGVNVIDLSQVEDTSSAHHSKFSESPEIVRIIGQRINAGDELSTQSTATDLTIQRVGDVLQVFSPG